MDWIKDFEARFADDDELSRVAAKKLHGSIQINFCDGHPVNYNLTIHKRSSLNFTVNTMAAPVWNTTTSNKGE